jgi:hypothetical protein
MLIATDEKTKGPGELKSAHGALLVNTNAGSIAAVAPNDNTDLPNVAARGLWVGGAGNVEVIAENDTAPVTFLAVAAGTLLPVRAKRVLNASTTATNILALI